MIGPVTNIQANLVGGATISFGYLVDYLEKEKRPFSLVNTKRFPKGFLKVLNPLYIICKVLFSLGKTDVVFLNSSRGGTKFLAPILYFLSRLFAKKFVFRPFGGDIKDYTAKYGSLNKRLFEKTVLQSDILFLQTKELMAFYASQNANTIQLPTSRNLPSKEQTRKEELFRKRFVFLGGVNTAKGVGLIIDAQKALGKDYLFHVYGPLQEEAIQEGLDKFPGMYQGILKKEDVSKTLSRYDVLVLPTWYEGEGYPGVILEAYAVGLPVITTNWKAIPEIVQDGKTGILVEPRNLDEFVQGIKHFNTDNHPSFSKNARTFFTRNFVTEDVTAKAILQIDALFGE